MILIISDFHDIHANIVEDKLKERKLSFFRLNLDTISLKNTFISYDGQNWTILQAEKVLHLSQVTKVWLRRAFVELSLEENTLVDVDFKIWRNEWDKTLSGLYLNLQSAKWLNPLREAYRAENKYYQFKIASELGFVIPEMVVSNIKADLLKFALQPHVTQPNE